MATNKSAMRAPAKRKNVKGTQRDRNRKASKKEDSISTQTNEEIINDDGTQMEQRAKNSRSKVIAKGKRTADGQPDPAHLRQFCLDAVNIGVTKLTKDFNETRAASLKAPISRTAFDKNMDKNRYKDVICGDEGRVVLSWPPGHANDYIHANWVPVRGEKRYICTQGPTEKTVEDFWRLVWQEKCRGIVMLCGVMEMGKKKCEQYWPSHQGESITSGQVTIKNTKVHEFEKSLVATNLELSAQGHTHKMEHIIWNGWPDRGVPDNYLASLRLIRKVSAMAPVLVHCSAGIGRTGTIVGLDMCLQSLSSNEKVTMADIVKDLRVYRHGSVQTDMQYIYMHRVLIALAENKKVISKDEVASWISDFDAFIKAKGG
uniref:Protein-tyrosine phosphatase n=1 Tax=Steinernema glaseri TaxID=37863 RepID=A0A1I7ZRU1_9BILA